jgi:hypothetical protein
VQKPVLRLAFVAAMTAVLLWIVLSEMARLPWQLDVLIAIAAALAFAFYFERDEDPRKM